MSNYFVLIYFVTCRKIVASSLKVKNGMSCHFIKEMKQKIPPLKARNPNMRMKPPRAANGTLCPRMGLAGWPSLENLPIRGPMISAATKEMLPPHLIFIMGKNFWFCFFFFLQMNDSSPSEIHVCSLDISTAYSFAHPACSRPAPMSQDWIDECAYDLRFRNKLWSKEARSHSTIGEIVNELASLRHCTWDYCGRSGCEHVLEEESENCKSIAVMQAF